MHDGAYFLEILSGDLKNVVFLVNTLNIKSEARCDENGVLSPNSWAFWLYLLPQVCCCYLFSLFGFVKGRSLLSACFL